VVTPSIALSPRFAEHFGLGKSQHDLDFVDVLLETDIPLYVDPFAFKVGDDDRSIICNNLVVDFFEHIVECIRGGNSHRGRSLLNNLHEPNSTRFGLSSGRPQGRGIGGDKANDLFARLNKSRAVKTGILRDLSDCELMIPGIGNDNISDITINVIRQELASYTEEQCHLWKVPTKRVSCGPAWFPDKDDWKSIYANLPVYKGRQVLLIPKEFARYHLAADHRQYYDQFVLEYLQQENLNSNSSLVKVLKNGRRTVTKKSLKEHHPCSKEFLLEFSEKHPEILQEYKNSLSFKANPLSSSSLEAFLKQKQQEAGTITLIVQPGGSIVSNHNEVHGDNFGAVGGGTVNARDIIVYKNTITKSSLPEELKAVLLKAREELDSQKLSEADKNDVADSLGNLTNELEKEVKEPTRIARWINRIGEITASIAGVVKSCSTIQNILQGQQPTSTE
jgi:hypothetical protein